MRSLTLTKNMSEPSWLGGCETDWFSSMGEMSGPHRSSNDLRALRGLLTTLGFDVEVSQLSGELLPILRENNCPYHDLASRDASICDLEQTVFSEVLGVPVNRTQCCRDGDQCCEFSATPSASLQVASWRAVSRET